MPRPRLQTGLAPRRATAAVAGALLLALPMAAQNQPTPTPTPPGAQPPTAPTAPAAQGQEPGRPTLKKEGDYIVFSMNETSGMELKEFIKWAHELTQKRIVYTESEIGQSPTGNRVSFLGTFRFKQDTFAKDFFSFFQIMLYIKGFAIVPRGSGDLELLEIVFLTGQRGREVTSGARYVDLEHIPDYKDQVGVPILTTVPLKNINATIATNALRPFFAASGGAPGVQGGITLGTAGNNTSLLLQGFGPQVYDAVQLLQLVDKPVEAPELITEVHRLEYAAPEEIEPMLTEIMETRQKARAAAISETGGTGPSGAPMQGAQQLMKVVVNPALKAIILSGNAEQMREALDLVARLDVPPEPIDGQANVIRLKNILAEDLRSTLNDFTREDQQADTAATQGQPGAAAARRPRRTVIQAFKESNSLLVSASSTKFKQLQALIDELDKKQPQVLIEAALVELTTGDLANIGIELGGIDASGTGNFTRPFGFTSFAQSTFQDTDGDGLPDTRLPDFQNPLQGLTGGILKGSNFAIPFLINALATNDRANILSLPSVLVNNNSPATVKTEESRPTLTSNQGTATTSQSVGAPRTAGITMEISPTISPNNYLRLNVNLQVSRFVGAFDPNSASGGGITLSRDIRTQVTMPSGDTMVIGGVIEDQESHTDAGVPFLKDIPLLGILFRSSSDTTNKTNLYFFVTPTILDEDDFDDLWQLSLQRKMDAERYIGSRRMQVVDRKWQSREAAKANTLEDPGATVEDIDRHNENDFPKYHRPPAKWTQTAPTGPASPSGQPQQGEAPKTSAPGSTPPGSNPPDPAHPGGNE